MFPDVYTLTIDALYAGSRDQEPLLSPKAYIVRTLDELLTNPTHSRRCGDEQSRTKRTRSASHEARAPDWENEDRGKLPWWVTCELRSILEHEFPRVALEDIEPEL